MFSAKSIVHGWGRKGRWCNWTIAKLLICSMRARSRQSWSYQQNTGLFAARLQRIFWTIRMTQKNVSTTLIWVHGIRYRLKTQTRYWPIFVESFAICRLWSTTPIQRSNETAFTMLHWMNWRTVLLLLKLSRTSWQPRSFLLLLISSLIRWIGRTG